MNVYPVTTTTLEKVDSSSNKFYRVYDLGQEDPGFVQYGRQDTKSGRNGGQWKMGGNKAARDRKIRDGYSIVYTITFSIDKVKYNGASLKDRQELLNNLLIATANGRGIDLNQKVVASNSNASNSISNFNGQPCVSNPFDSRYSGGNLQSIILPDKMTAFSEACLDAIVAASEGDTDKALLAYGKLTDELEDLIGEFEAAKSYFSTLEMLIQESE